MALYTSDPLYMGTGIQCCISSGYGYDIPSHSITMSSRGQFTRVDTGIQYICINNCMLLILTCLVINIFLLFKLYSPSENIIQIIKSDRRSRKKKDIFYWNILG